MTEQQYKAVGQSSALRRWHLAAVGVVLASCFLPTLPAHTTLLTVMPPRPIEDRARTAPTPNPDGAFEELVISGSIRPARPDEFDKWFRMAPRGEIKQYRSSLRSHSFVILRPVQLPPGMYGAHSRVFIIPRGVPIPRGFLKSHNTFLLMDSGACLGTMCDS